MIVINEDILNKIVTSNVKKTGCSYYLPISSFAYTRKNYYGKAFNTSLPIRAIPIHEVLNKASQHQAVIQHAPPPPTLLSKKSTNFDTVPFLSVMFFLHELNSYYLLKCLSSG